MTVSINLTSEIESTLDMSEPIIERTEDALPEDMEKVDFDILKMVMGRLIPIKNGDDENILGLEVIAGPYKGVVFSFISFDVLPYRTRNGMVPTKFETKVFKSPDGFKADEAWDRFTAELFVAWLVYIQRYDIGQLARLPTIGGTH